MTKINLATKLAQFSDHWSPKVIGQLNGQDVRLVKFQGEFVWHHHAEADELFLVLEGTFTMHYRNRNLVEQRIELVTGDMLIVPRGTEHRPVAEQEVSVLLFEPSETLNTGSAEPCTLTRAAMPLG